MSSNIKIQRICQHCKTAFIARTTVTRYCSQRCASYAYKAKVRIAKVEGSNKETQLIVTQPIDFLKAKEFLTVRDVSKLLSCSIRTAYRLIKLGNIRAVNLAQRKTLVRRSDIDKIFEQPQSVNVNPDRKSETIPFEISACYNLTEVESKYGISESALKTLIKRNGMTKIKRGRYAYIPKVEIDKLLRQYQE